MSSYCAKIVCFLPVEQATFLSNITTQFKIYLSITFLCHSGLYVSLDDQYSDLVFHLVDSLGVHLH
jgi:hypothetical protein